MPGTDRLPHSFPAWDNGYIARFQKYCDCFCSNCNYTTLLIAETPGYYSITAKSSGAIQSIDEDDVYDAVVRFGLICYEYYVSDPDVDL